MSIVAGESSEDSDAGTKGGGDIEITSGSGTKTSSGMVYHTANGGTNTPGSTTSAGGVTGATLSTGAPTNGDSGVVIIGTGAAPTAGTGGGILMTVGAGTTWCGWCNYY